MKIVFGYYSITQTKKGYKIQPLEMENISQWVTKKIEYHPTLVKALNRVHKLGVISVSDVDPVMEQCDKLMEGHGVEAIRDPDQFVYYWCETRVLYVNMGDTYVETILYDTLKKKFYAMSWGDFVEKYDKKGKW